MNQLTEFLNQHYQQVATDDNDGAPQRQLHTARDVIPRRRPTARPARIPRHAERDPDDNNVQRSST